MRTLFIIIVLLISASAFGQSKIEIGSEFRGAFLMTGDYRLEKKPGGWQQGH